MQTTVDHPQNEILKRLLDVETSARDLVDAAEREAADLLGRERASLETAKKLRLEEKAAECERRVNDAKTAMLADRDARLDSLKTELRAQVPDVASFETAIRALLEKEM